jgi:hypothetical protein
MDRIKAFLTVLSLAGCGGGGSGAHDDAGHVGSADDAHVGGQDGSDSSDGGMPGGDASSVSATNDRCVNAIPISIAATRATLDATMIGATADLAAPCGTAGTPDVFYKFTLTRRELVYADTFGASSDTALYFASSCTTARTMSTTPGDAVCSSGACGTGQSQVIALLDPGTHYLVLASSGAATIHFQHAEVGTGTVEYLAQGVSAPTGTTSGFGDLYECLAPGPENAYWWATCPGDPGGTFLASTCTGTQFDTILTLQMPGTGQDPLCSDDVCSFQSSMSASIPAGAGLLVIDVDGNSAAEHGNYTLSVSRP